MVRVFALAFLALYAPLEGGGVMRAARQIYLGGHGGGWKNPYVTDGLVAMWDGEWNSGPGVHAPNATTWVDLSGNGHDLPSLGTPDWRYDDGMYGAYMTTKANCFGDMSSGWFRDLWASQAGAYVEAVAKGAYNYCLFGFGGQPQTWQSYDIDVSNISGTAQYWRMRGESQEFYSVCLVSPYRIWTWQNLDSFAAAVNRLQTVSGTYTYQGHNGNGFCIGSRGDQYGNRSIQGMISRVAVYDRMLTAAENAANYAIDKERFGLP